MFFPTRGCVRSGFCCDYIMVNAACVRSGKDKRDLLCTHTNKCKHGHMHVYTHTHTQMHAHTHTSIHTHTSLDLPMTLQWTVKKSLNTCCSKCHHWILLGWLEGHSSVGWGDNHKRHPIASYSVVQLIRTGSGQNDCPIVNRVPESYWPWSKAVHYIGNRVPESYWPSTKAVHYIGNRLQEY